MRKQIFAFCICLIILSLFTSKSFAAPIINEFSSADSSDWVEIYNTGPEEIDLSKYRIRDLTANNELNLSGSLGPSAYVSFDWSNKLNNGGDLIKLVLISDESIIDQISYGDQGGLTAPSLGQSAGRKTDGGQEWTLFTSFSKGTSNNSSFIYTPPTPTPSKTPTPTRSPSPTKIPTVTKSSSALSLSVVSKTPTPVKQVTATYSSSNAFVKDTGIKTTVKSAKITHTLRAASEFAKIKPITKVENKKEVKVLGVKSANISPYIFLAGFTFLMAAIAIFLQKILKEKEIL